MRFRDLPTSIVSRKSEAQERVQLGLRVVNIEHIRKLVGFLPKLLWFPSLLPLSSALASKLLKLFNPVTTVALVTASNAAAPYSAPCVCTRPSRTNAMVQDTTPIWTTFSGCMRLITEPWSSDATSPMKPRRRPVSLASYENRSYVMNGKLNSMPLKKRMKVKCVALSRVCEFVRTRGLGVSAFA